MKQCNIALNTVYFFSEGPSVSVKFLTHCMRNKGTVSGGFLPTRSKFTKIPFCLVLARIWFPSAQNSRGVARNFLFPLLCCVPNIGPNEDDNDFEREQTLLWDIEKL